MKFNGVVFDFNGTLFLDSVMHERAWKKVASEIVGRPITTEEYYRDMNGKCNRLIMEILLGDRFTEEALQQAEVAKEQRYRELCLAEPGFIQFINGAEQLFDWLKGKGIPMAIATASEISNVRFYREQFGLDRWFPPERIIYNDGSFPLKPAPDIYLKAAAVLGLSPAELVIAEDSYAGLRAAHAAGAGWLYGISAGQEQVIGAELCNAVIPDMNHFDKELF